jgi:hypothetical protein
MSAASKACQQLVRHVMTRVPDLLSATDVERNTQDGCGECVDDADVECNAGMLTYADVC